MGTEPENLTALAQQCRQDLEPSSRNEASLDVEDSWREEQLLRFRSWCGTLGVFAKGHASLDHRLRYDADLQAVIAQLLGAVHFNMDLVDGKYPGDLAPDDLDRTITPHQSNQVTLASPPSQSEASFLESLSTGDEDRSDEVSPAEILTARIEDALASLNSVAVLIRKYGAYQNTSRADSFIPKDAAGEDLTPEFHEYAEAAMARNLQSTFLTEHAWQTLLSSIVRRWRRIMYRRNHLKKLEGNQPEDIGLPTWKSGQDNTGEKRLEPSDSREEGKGDAPIPESRGEEPIKTPTMSATSASIMPPQQARIAPLSSGSSSRKTMSSLRARVLDLPPPPKIRHKDVFECPYCCILCPRKEAVGRRWREHIMRDLAPYVCIFTNCDFRDSFRTSAEWISHIQRQHLPVKWSCNACPYTYEEARASSTGKSPVFRVDKYFNDDESFRKHITDEHSADCTKDQLTFLTASSICFETEVFLACPFCDEFEAEFETLKEEEGQKQHALQKHIGGHMQTLALISLPWDHSALGSADSNNRAQNSFDGDAVDEVNEKDDFYNLPLSFKDNGSSTQYTPGNNEDLIQYRTDMDENVKKLSWIWTSETEEQASSTKNPSNLKDRFEEWYKMLSQRGYDLDEIPPDAQAGSWEWLFQGNFLPPYDGVETDPILAPFVIRYKQDPILSVGNAEFSAVLDRRLADQDAFQSPSAWRDQVLYFVLPDRFSDGRERVIGGPSAPLSGRDTPAFMFSDMDNATMTESDASHWREAGQRFVGGTIKGIEDKLEYLRNLGVTTIWLGPIFSQCSGEETYHGFSVQNFLDVDERFGTREDLIKLVQHAHDVGIYVLLSVVMHSTGNVFEYDQARPTYNGHTFPVRGFRDASGKPVIPMSETMPPTSLAQPSEAVWPKELQHQGAFTRKGSIVNWDAYPEYLEGDFFDLKKLSLGSEPFDGANFTANATLKTICEVYKFWLALADFDGFHIDYVKHVGPAPMRYFTQAIREFAAQIGKENFLISGGASGLFRVADCLTRYGLDAVGEHPLIQELSWKVPKGLRDPLDHFHYSFTWSDHTLASSDQTEWDVYQRFLVKMVDDMDQIWLGRRKARYCSDEIGRRTVVSAIAFCLCTAGIPAIYYGTEQGFDGNGGRDHYIREAMFGGEFGAFRSTNRHFFDPSNPIYIATSKLCRFRRESLTLRRGQQYLRQISGDGVSFGYPKQVSEHRMRSMIAWSRIYDGEELICVISTDYTTSQTAWVTIDAKIHESDHFIECICSSDEALEGNCFEIADKNGKAVALTVCPGNYAIFRKVT